MKATRVRRQAFAALLVGIVALVAAACAPDPGPPYYGIIFNAPSVGYVGKTYNPTATATSGLPVTLTLDASSTGCTFDGTTVTYTGVGLCVINANQPGDGTHPAMTQIQRKIGVYTCPPLLAGIWTGSAVVAWNTMTLPNIGVNVYQNQFWGTVDLAPLGLGLGVVGFSGTVACEVASMTFNGVAVGGTLAPDGKTIWSSYNDIPITLYYNDPQP